MPEFNPNSAERYIVRHKGKRIGPLTEDQVQRMLGRGQLTDQHELALAGTTDWQRIGQWRAPSDPVVETPSQPAGVPSIGIENTTAENSSSKTGGDWYVAIGDQQHGPMDESSIGVLIREGKIARETLVWRNGMESWSSAGDVFPAVLAGSAGRVSSMETTGGSNESGKGIEFNTQNNSQGMVSDRRGWVLTLCVFTYVFAIEALAGAIFLIHTAVVVRRSDAVTTFSIAAVVALIVTVVLLTAAIHMTRLVAAMDRLGRTDSLQYAKEVAIHDRRVWVTGVWLGTIVLLCQAALLLMILIGTARVT